MGLITLSIKKELIMFFFRNLILINSKHVYLKTKANNWASDHHPVVTYLKHIN